MSFSRREILQGGAVLASRALPVTGAVSALLVPAPAIAQVDPVTIEMAASVGYKLYSMFRSGGGSGTNQLLRAQATMLHAINAQLNVINQELLGIWRKLDDLTILLRKMPKATVVQFYTDTLGGHIRTAFELMEAYAGHLGDRGRAHALSQVEAAARLRLHDLQTARATLFPEPAPAVVPVVCAAWFAELQLQCTVLPFDPYTLQQSALAYRAALTTWMDALSLDMKGIAKESDGLKSRLDASLEMFNGWACLEDIKPAFEHGIYPGYNGEVTDRYQFSWNRGVASAKPRSAPNQTLDYRAQLEELEACDIPVAPSLLALEPRHWGSEYHPGHWDTGRRRDYSRARSEYQDENGMLLAKACPGPSMYPRQFAKDRNGLGEAADLLQMRAISTYSLMLAATTTRSSIDSVLKRLGDMHVPPPPNALKSRKRSA